MGSARSCTSAELSSATCLLMWYIHALQVILTMETTGEQIMKHSLQKITNTAVTSWLKMWRRHLNRYRQEKLSLGLQGCVWKWWDHVLMLWMKMKPALNWLISVFMGLTDVRRHTWHFYLCSHSRISLVHKGWERGSCAGPCLSSRQGLWGRWHPWYPSSKVSSAPSLPPSYLSRTSFCGWNLDSVPEPWGRGQNSAARLGCRYLPGAFC